MWKSVALSLTGSLTLWCVSFLKDLERPSVSLAVGVVLMGFIVYLSRQMRTVDHWTHVFRLFSWTGNLDAMLALGVAGFTTRADFYLDNAEPYFRTGHGFAINAWDATVHWALLLYLLSLPSSFSSTWAGPLWAGSTLNSMPVFLLPGLFSSAFRDKWSSAIFLNVPYFLMPLLYLRRIYHQNRFQSREWTTSTRWLMRGVAALHWCRAAAVMGWLPKWPCEEPYESSALAFGAVQAVVYALSTTLLCLNSRLDATLLWAWCGGTLQGEFSFVIGALYHPTRYALPLSNVNMLITPSLEFLALHLSLLLMPLILLSL